MDTRNLSNHSSYEAGRGIQEVARNLDSDPGDLIKLSSNENVLGPSPKAIESIQNNASQCHVYPKASHTDLISSLAQKFDVSTEQIWLSNGGDGALDCLARAFLRPGDKVLTPNPGFAYYSMSARFHHGKVNNYELNKYNNFDQTAENPLNYYQNERIIYITSPHNPTGSEMNLDEIQKVASKTDDDTLILVDEAYGLFTNSPSAVALVEDRDDVAVLRSFSKSYGLAGLRLGYLITPDQWADQYKKIHTPFDSGELACRAGLAAIKDDEHLSRTLNMVRKARKYLYDNLPYRTWKSGGNFVLVEVGNAQSVTEKAKKQGVIVRDCSSFGLPGCIRITCGTTEMMKQTVNVLNNIYKSKHKD